MALDGDQDIMSSEGVFLVSLEGVNRCQYLGGTDHEASFFPYFSRRCRMHRFTCFNFPPWKTPLARVRGFDASHE